MRAWSLSDPGQCQTLGNHIQCLSCRRSAGLHMHKPFVCGWLGCVRVHSTIAAQSSADIDKAGTYNASLCCACCVLQCGMARFPNNPYMLIMYANFMLEARKDGQVSRRG